jgi:two-component sensor histidine kinase
MGGPDSDNGPSDPSGPKDESGTKASLAELLIRVCAIIAVLAYFPSAYLSWREKLWVVLAADTAAFIYIVLLALLRALPYKLKVASIFAISYGLGVMLLLTTGPFGAGHLYLFCFVVLVGLFGGTRLLVAANLLCAASYGLYALFAERAHPAWAQGAASVLVISANAVMLGAVLSAAANYLVRRYSAAAAAERRLRQLRETMLREIDHRVKNNLQMISSLVSLRSRSGSDPAEALGDIRESLATISLVHQLLDRENVSYSLKAGRFLKALFDRFGSIYPDVAFEYEWKGSDIEVDSDIGIDLGVMINEIVANSIKHAFRASPEGRRGLVFLRAAAEEGTRKLSLVLGDDGGGLTDDTGRAADGPSAQGGQGRKIIDALARHLDAEMSVDTSRGFVYHIELRFPELDEAEGPGGPHGAHRRKGR